MFRSTQYLFVQVIILLLTKCTFQNNINQQCGVRQVSINELVLRGVDAKPGYWPWHAIVYHRENRIHKYACGGTLISEKFVLTAKHCVVTSNKYKMNVKNIYIQLGIHDINDLNPHTFQQHQVKEINLAPGSPTLRHDIALIELRTEANLTQFVQPACLDDRNIIGKQGTAIGFGVTETGEVSDVLKQCTMPVVDGYECVQSDRAFGHLLDETVVCAGHTSGCKVCNGDSGGGLHFHRNGVWYVGGIIAFSPSDNDNEAVCSSTGFAAFTRVDKYLNWIEDKTKIHVFRQQSSGNLTDQGKKLCTLKSGGAGQCRMLRECGSIYSEDGNTCGFIENEPMVCCDVVRRQCDAIRPNKYRFARLVGSTSLAKNGEFPFMALIMYKRSATDNTFISHARCGATLISKRFLLTAARCYYWFIPYSVKLGTTDANDAEADFYLIDKFHRHEEYNEVSDENDIALLQVAEDILLNESIKPICIYNHPDELPDSVDLSVMGWGKENSGGRSIMLLKGFVRTMPLTTCQTRLEAAGWLLQLKDTQMCAIGDKNQDGKATDFCRGDEGGPLVLKEDNKNHLVAIASFDHVCGDLKYPGLYSRVYKFLPWIIEKGVFNNL